MKNNTFTDKVEQIKALCEQFNQWGIATFEKKGTEK